MSSRLPQAFLIFSGFNSRAIVAVCRALEQDHRRFHIVACTASDPIFSTAWRKFVIATRNSTALDWEDVVRCIRKASIDAQITRWSIAPSSEFLVRWCLDRRRELGGLGCNLPLPDRATYLLVSDKRSFTDFCRNRGLPVPEEADSMEKIGLPCVAKPIVNLTSAGISLYPWLLRTPEDVAKFQASTSPKDYFFQKWIEGESLYLLFHLSRSGKSVRFSQRNLAQQPGGKSIVLAEAATFHQNAHADAWEDALRASGFFGLAMIELRVEDGGRPVLIEANPRLWGPLQLVHDHSPALIEAYFDDILGKRSRRPSAFAANPAERSVYLWFGGAIQTWKAGRSLEWHVLKPLFPCLSLLRYLRRDVYLRSDTWRCFWGS